MTDTIPRRLMEQGRTLSSAPAYHVRRNGQWHATSWQRYAEEVRRAAKALIALGVKPGGTVCILGFNRPEWVVMDLACMAVGGAPAGIYATSSPEEVRYIVNHAEAPVVLVENLDQWAKIRAERDNLPALRHVVLMGGTEAPSDPWCMGWDDFTALGDKVDEAELDARIAALEPNALATLIYTSGTTGPPKAVMLSHRNLTWTAEVARSLGRTGPTDCGLSYLPLSHIAEQVFTIHAAVTSGSQVYFAESIERVPDNLKEVQPTVMFGVPRIWEKFHAGMSAKLGQATGVKKRLADWAQRVGRRVADVRCLGREPSGLLAIEYALASRLVYSKVKAAVGLSRGKLLVSGAAPIAREVLEFFAGFDLIVLEVYGQSEDTGPTSFNQHGRFRFGSVGPVFPGVEVKIAEDGEIRVRGPNVFLGYYKEPAATAETLVDGWLCSGDLGRFDEDGFLYITGRKKDIIITAGGKNIAPRNLEEALCSSPLVAEAVVIGDRRKYLTALVGLDREAVARFVATRNLAPETAEANAEVKRELDRLVEAVNAKLARVEQIKKYQSLPRNLGMDTGELTPTLKIKRNVVARNFEALIESMYADGGDA